MVGKRKASKDDEPRVTPKSVAGVVKAVGVAKVMVPVILPMVAPYAVHAASAARERYEKFRAKRLGVGVDDLAEFSGKGAALHARIAGDQRVCTDLLARDGASEADPRFVAEAATRLDDLTAAVRAAEAMPAPRRKAAHTSVASELDTLERELMNRLGVPLDSVR